MISNVIKDGNHVLIYNERGMQTQCLYIGGNGRIVGITAEFFVVQVDEYIEVYNESGMKFSDFYIGRGKTVTTVGDIINVAEGSYIERYNKDGRRV